MSSTVRMFVFCALLAALPGCQKATRTEPSGGDTLGDSIALERTRCFGSCPTYRVRLARDGSVHFESRNPQDSGRVAEDRVPPDAVLRLLQDVAALHLDSLPAELMGVTPYCPLVRTDSPHAIITWYRAQGVQRVNDYHGCTVERDQSGRQVLRRLRAFEQAVDSVAGVSRWRTPYRRND